MPINLDDPDLFSPQELNENHLKQLTNLKQDFSRYSHLENISDQFSNDDFPLKNDLNSDMLTFSYSTSDSPQELNVEQGIFNFIVAFS